MYAHSYNVDLVSGKEEIVLFQYMKLFGFCFVKYIRRRKQTL